MGLRPLASLVIPVYRNEESLVTLVDQLTVLAHQVERQHAGALEVVFVVDASPDHSHRVLSDLLASAPFPAQLLLHSRNFGSFAAIRTGLAAARGEFFAVLAADLQEPPDLVLKFLEELIDNDMDVVVGRRTGREDRAVSRLAARLFWSAYRAAINREIPVGGVDVFGCNLRFRNELLALKEANSSLVALIYWLGFRRAEVPYGRLSRPYGKSAWTLRKKTKYMLDSVFAFTSLPISILMAIGALGSALAALLGVITIVARISGAITVSGYAGVFLAVVFFGALNLLGLGLIGSYAWRTFENTKQRPISLVRTTAVFEEGATTVDDRDLRDLRDLPTQPVR